MTVSSSSAFPDTSTPRLVSSPSTRPAAGKTAEGGEKTKRHDETPGGDAEVVDKKQMSFLKREGTKCFSVGLEHPIPDGESSPKKKIDCHPGADGETRPAQHNSGDCIVRPPAFDNDDEDLIKGLGETASLVFRDMKTWISNQIQTNIIPPTRSFTSTCGTPFSKMNPSWSSSASLSSSLSSTPSRPHQHPYRSLHGSSQQHPHHDGSTAGAKLQPNHPRCHPSSSFSRKDESKTSASASSTLTQQHPQRDNKNPSFVSSSSPNVTARDAYTQRTQLHLFDPQEHLSEDWTFKPEGIFSSFLSLFDVDEDQSPPNQEDSTARQHREQSGRHRQTSSYPPPPRGFPGQPAVVSSSLYPLPPPSSSSSFRIHTNPSSSPPLPSSSSYTSFHLNSRLADNHCFSSSSFFQDQQSPAYPPRQHAPPPPSSYASSSFSCQAPSPPSARLREAVRLHPQHQHRLLHASPEKLRPHSRLSSPSSPFLQQSLSLSPPGGRVTEASWRAEEVCGGTTVQKNTSFRESKILPTATTTTSQPAPMEAQQQSRFHPSQSNHFAPSALFSSSGLLSGHPQIDTTASTASSSSSAMLLLSPESIEEPADGFVKPQLWLTDASVLTRQSIERSHVELSLLKLHNIGKPISSSVISGHTKLHCPGFNMLGLRIPIIDTKKQMISIGFSVHISQSHLQILQALEQYERRQAQRRGLRGDPAMLGQSASGRKASFSQRDDEAFLRQESQQIALLKKHLQWHRRIDEDRKRDAVVLNYRIDVPVSSILQSTNNRRGLESTWVVLAEDRPVQGITPEAFFNNQRTNAEQMNYQPRLLFTAKPIMSGVNALPLASSSSTDAEGHAPGSKYVYTAQHDDPLDISIADVVNRNFHLLDQYSSIKRISPGQYIINSYPCRVFLEKRARSEGDSKASCTSSMIAHGDRKDRFLTAPQQEPAPTRLIDTTTTTGGEGDESDKSCCSHSRSSFSSSSPSCSGTHGRAEEEAEEGCSLLVVEEDDGTRQPLTDYLQGNLDNIVWGDEYDFKNEKNCPSAIDMVDEDLLPPLHKTLVPWEALTDRRAAMSLACHRAAIREQVAIELLCIQGRRPPPALHKKHLSPVLVRFSRDSPPVYVTYTWTEEYTDMRLVVVGEDGRPDPMVFPLPPYHHHQHQLQQAPQMFASSRSAAGGRAERHALPPPAPQHHQREEEEEEAAECSARRAMAVLARGLPYHPHLQHHHHHWPPSI